MDGWPLVLFGCMVALIVGSMLALSALLGERHAGRDAQEPYESGIPPSGSARSRYSAQFYLIAMFFLIFDLEAVFLFAWAVAASDLGWGGYLSAGVFIGVLLAALVYLWRDGALEWGSAARPLLEARAAGGAELPRQEEEGRYPWTGG